MTAPRGLGWVLRVAAAGAGLASVVVGLTPAAAEPVSVAPPAERLTARAEVVTGSGCPDGAVEVGVFDGNDAFSVKFGQYPARAGGGAAVTSFSRGCQVDVLLSQPAGYSLAIAGVEYRGTAHLASGVVGLVQGIHFFSGATASPMTRYTFTGPYDGAWAAVEEVEPQLLAFLPCGGQRHVAVNIVLRVGNGRIGPDAPASDLSLVPAGGGPGAVYHLAWRSCAAR